MRLRSMYRLLVALLVVSLSCNFLTQKLPASAGSGDFSAKPSSAVSVHLEWKAIAGASAYLLEARYGGNFFPVGSLAGDQTSYDHFVVPGSTSLTYRLSAVTRTDQQQVGTADVHMPELKPDPLTVEVQPQTPTTFQIPTIDPNHPENFDPFALLKSIQASQDIGPEGGTVNLTDSNQTLYTLSVPPGALDQTVSVGLTAIGAVKGSPLSGGLLGAVQVTPRIPFNLPLTLTIRLPDAKPIPAAPLTVGFSIAGFSNEFFLYPAKSDNGSSFTMSVDWGDTFGVGAATLQDVQGQAKQIPTDAAAQMAQLIVALRASNSDSGADTDELIYDQLIEGILQRIDQIVVLNSSTIQASDGVYPIRASFGVNPNKPGQKTRAANQLAQAIEFAYQTWEYGGGGMTASLLAVRTRLVAAIKAFVKKTEKACLTPDALYVEYVMNKMESARTNKNASAGHDFWAWLAEAYGDTQDLARCTFELEISSTIVSTTPEFTVTAVVRTKKPISLQITYRDDGIILWGDGDLVYDSYTAKTRACANISVSPLPKVSLQPQLQAVFDESGDMLTDFLLSRFDVRDDAGAQTLKGCGGSQPLPGYVGLWGDEFTQLRVPADGVVKGWKADNGFAAGAPNVFRRAFPNHPAPFIGGTVTENTTFTLSVDFANK